MNFFKIWFGASFRSRHAFRLFGRNAMLETVSRGNGSAHPVPQRLSRDLFRAADEDVPSLLLWLDAHEDGLSSVEASRRLTEAGANKVAHEQPMSWWMHLWHCYRNPFNLLLTLLATVSYLTDDVKATLVIGTMVVLSTLTRFVQQGRSNRAAENLKALVGNTATVVRRDLRTEAAEVAERYFDAKPLKRHAPSRVEVPIRGLVPGDQIVLSAGDMVPADCRVLQAKDLFISQSAMTGESLPVEKFTDRQGSVKSPLEQANILFMGTNVVSGAAIALVIATGKNTYIGTLATRVTASDRALTAFQAGVNSVSWLLIRFALLMVPIVLLVNGFTKGDWTEAFLFALSVAVGLTPEMLPMIVTSTLAKGAVLLSRKKVIVKRLDAIQNFGAMDVLCTDKTGTLTQDHILLERHIDVLGKESAEALKFAYLNSYYQTGLKNLLDRAVLKHAELQRELNLGEDYRKVDEIPFDFQRRRMSVVVSEREDHHELICKGAVEEVLSVCTRVRLRNRDESLDDHMLASVRRITRGLNDEGLRVVAVAVKEMPSRQEAYSVTDESSLTLIGYVAFLDPPKESTAPALQALAARGVTVKILTGDNELVTAKVCEQVGLKIDGVLLGHHIDRMSDTSVARCVELANVFARLSPLNKERLVRALRANGHVVGFMRDGINDAPALRAACCVLRTLESQSTPPWTSPKRQQTSSCSRRA